MGRPIQYPNQLVIQVDDDTDTKVRSDAALRGDGSVSAAARRLLALGVMVDKLLGQKEVADLKTLDVERMLLKARAVK